MEVDVPSLFRNTRTKESIMAKGPGNNEAQIKALRKKLGEGGVSNANAIVKSASADEIALAFKMSRPSSTKQLPRAVTKLLGKVPAGMRKQMEEKLTEAANA